VAWRDSGKLPKASVHESGATSEIDMGRRQFWAPETLLYCAPVTRALQKSRLLNATARTCLTEAMLMCCRLLKVSQGCPRLEPRISRAACRVPWLHQISIVTSAYFSGTVMFRTVKAGVLGNRKWNVVQWGRKRNMLIYHLAENSDLCKIFYSICSENRH
jgi:hypothetical protein